MSWGYSGAYYYAYRLRLGRLTKAPVSPTDTSLVFGFPQSALFEGPHLLALLASEPVAIDLWGRLRSRDPVYRVDGWPN